MHRFHSMLYYSVLLSLLVSQTAFATAYYVDAANGSDDASGTSPEDAWKTLERVNMASFQPGDRLLFRAGVQWSGTLILSAQGSAEKNILVGRYGTGADPIIDGNGAKTVLLLKNSRHVHVANLTLTNPGEAGPHRNGIRAKWTEPGNYKNVVLQDLTIHNVRGRTDRPAFYKNAGIFFRVGHKRAHLRNPVIKNCTLRDIRGVGCHINASQRQGHNIHYPVFRNNTIRRTGADGFIAGNCTSLLFEQNRCYGAGVLGSEKTKYIAGVWTHHTHHSVFQYNEVARTQTPRGDGNAFDVDKGATGTHVFQYNYTHENEGGPLMVMPQVQAEGGILYRYNISVNDFKTPHPQGHEAFWVPDSNVRIYNNTFYTNDGDPISITDSKKVSVRNNVFVMESGSFTYPSKPTYERNCFFGDLQAPDPKSILKDPKLKNPGTVSDGMQGAIHYRLTRDSPCRNAGVRIENNGGQDFWSTPLNEGPPDVGAHEWISDK